MLTDQLVSVIHHIFGNERRTVETNRHLVVFGSPMPKCANEYEAGQELRQVEEAWVTYEKEHFAEGN